MFAVINFVAIPTFKRVIPSLRNGLHLIPEDEHRAKRVGEVGLTLVITDSQGCLSGWSLIFPLKNFQHHVNKDLVEDFRSAFLLGHFTNLSSMDCIRNIIASDSNETERKLLTLRLSSSAM